MRIRCALFDLDGTLVDSLQDIAAALDAALARYGHAPLSPERVAAFVGDGARTLVERALGASAAPLDDTDAVVASYLDEYRNRYLDTTRLYPGVDATLAALAEGDLRCGVVTNKPYEFSVSLLEHLGVASRFAVVIGGDSASGRKPSPAPLLAAMASCDAAPAETAMVGDGDADMRAGVAAGAFTVGVTYGFRAPDELRSAGAAALIASMPELPDVLRRA